MEGRPKRRLNGGGSLEGRDLGQIYHKGERMGRCVRGFQLQAHVSSCKVSCPVSPKIREKVSLELYQACLFYSRTRNTHIGVSPFPMASMNFTAKCTQLH